MISGCSAKSPDLAANNDSVCRLNAIAIDLWRLRLGIFNDLPLILYLKNINFFHLVLNDTINNFDRYLKLNTMGNLGATEIILILLVVVLLFGGRKIPELMKGIGQGMKEFKRASRVDDDKEKMSAEPKEEEKK